MDLFKELFYTFGKTQLEDEQTIYKKNIRGFKKRLLGLFGKNEIKSLDDIAGALQKIGLCSSLKEGMRITNKISNVIWFEYPIIWGYNLTLDIIPINGGKYEVRLWDPDDDEYRLLNYRTDT
ncbi:hypothetical protein K8R47_01940 [archaeon]|nr:hypothetical protein [archaeon]